MYSPFDTIRVGIGDWKSSVSAGAHRASWASLNHASSSREPGSLGVIAGASSDRGLSRFTPLASSSDISFLSRPEMAQRSGDRGRSQLPSLFDSIIVRGNLSRLRESMSE